MAAVLASARPCPPSSLPPVSWFSRRAPPLPSPLLSGSPGAFVGLARYERASLRTKPEEDKSESISKRPIQRIIPFTMFASTIGRVDWHEPTNLVVMGARETRLLWRRWRLRHPLMRPSCRRLLVSALRTSLGPIVVRPALLSPKYPTRFRSVLFE